MAAERILAADGRVLEREDCDHNEPTTTRVAHGYLGDAPRGTLETMCSGCGLVLQSTPPWPQFPRTDTYGWGDDE